MSSLTATQPNSLLIKPEVIVQPVASANGTTPDPLLGRTVNALSWRFVSEASRFALQMGVMVVLARLVSVDQFGLMSQAMVIGLFIIRMSELGMLQAVMQRKELTETHIRVCFTIATLAGAGYTIALFLAAPIAARLLGNPAVEPLLRFVSLLFISTTLGVTSLALLQRRLDFQTVMKAEFASYFFAYGILSIWLAWLGYGAWALAWALVVQALLRSFLLLWHAPHSMRPSLAPRESRELLHFGLGYSLSTIANNIAVNGDFFIIGRVLGAAALGLYARAYQLMMMPLYQFTSVISYVLFPVYAQMQDNVARLRHAYLSATAVTACCTFPLLALFGILAPEIMKGVFGPAWAGAAIALQILVIGGACQSVASLGDAVMRARGAVYDKFWCNCIYALAVLLGAYYGSRYGIAGVSWGVTLAQLLFFVVIGQLSIKLSEATWLTYLHSQLPGLALATAVVVVNGPLTYLLRQWEWHSLAILLVITITALLTFLATVIALPFDWLNRQTGGAVVTAREYLEGSQLAHRASRKCKEWLRNHPYAFALAEVPYNVYENLCYARHITQARLWHLVFGSERSQLCRDGQTLLTWQTALPKSQTADELREWLTGHGLTFHEGYHTFYLPPQPALKLYIPEVLDFYPANTGFKILKDFRAPQHANYLYQMPLKVLLRRLIGTPIEQLLSANALHLAELGPRVWDVCCWQSGEISRTVFVIEHCQGIAPTETQVNEFLHRTERVVREGHLSVYPPNWRANADFLPPTCNGNLLVLEKVTQQPEAQLFCITYIDFQNFGPGTFIQKTARGTSGNWKIIEQSLNENRISLHKRVVCHFGCGLGDIMHSALKAGSAWVIGFDSKDVIAQTKTKLLTAGLTRFSCYPIKLDELTTSLRQDLVCFCDPTAVNEVLFNQLIQQPWQVLVINNAPAKPVSAKVINVNATDGLGISHAEAAAMPLTIFIRSGATS